jgi:anti-anti-sigma regulatory factor
MASLNPDTHDDGAMILNEDGERGAAIPPADIPASLSAHLLSLSRAIADAQDEQSLGSALADAMSSCGADSFHLWRARPGAVLEVIAAWDQGGEPSPRAGERVPRSELRVLDAITPDKPIIISAADSRFDERTKRAELGGRSLGLYPLVLRGEVLGVFEIKHRNDPAPGEVQFLRTLAEIAAIGLLHLESRAELRTKIKRLKGLYDIAESISQMANSKEIVEEAASMLVSGIGYANCFIALVDESANVLREEVIKGAGDFPGKPPSVFPLDAVELTPVLALRADRPIMIEDIQKRADAEGWGDVARAANMRSAAYMSLRAGGKALGVLAFGSSDVRMSDDELSLLSAFGNQLASTLARVEMNIEREKQVAALERANESQARLLETVRELSTPVIPVHDGVLVLPLVGMIDTSRSAQVMESLLNAIQKERAQVVIIDITGVPTVDTGVANHLIRSTRAAALLGAMCVLVGVAPAVAQTLVQIGVDFGDLVTRSDLQAGIAYALDRIDRGAR